MRVGATGPQPYKSPSISLLICSPSSKQRFSSSYLATNASHYLIRNLHITFLVHWRPRDALTTSPEKISHPVPLPDCYLARNIAGKPRCPVIFITASETFAYFKLPVPVAVIFRFIIITISLVPTLTLHSCLFQPSGLRFT